MNGSTFGYVLKFNPYGVGVITRYHGFHPWLFTFNP
jgi:hypothetical protein